ncbi:MAG: LD-carboxypeptidase, partial [Bacillota bacterium]|nr:LD-carboxypeptidase [Bacillota bacterium]
FSDATSFLTYLNVKGLVTFYGPSVMAGFAQLKHAEPGYAGHIRDILYGDKFPYRYPRYEKWANGYKDWRNPELLGQFTELQEDGDGLVIIQGRGEVEGTLWGGCIEVLEFLKGTGFWPGEDFWNDKILFFETSEEKPLPQNVGYMLRNYGMQGIFDKVKAVMFGRPRDYSEEEKKELYSIVSSIVKEEFNAPDLPIIMNAEYGHTDPKIVLPIGGRLKINLDEKYLELLESPFE